MMEQEKIDKMTIEETFEAIEEIITHLQSDSIPLEEGFAYYEEGLKLIKHSNEYIDNVEKQIKILSIEDGNDEV